MKIDTKLVKKSGIYKITCLANNKIYIGSSKSIYQRLHRHRSDLRKNRHDNQNMQNSYNKYNEDMFCIDILEFCEINDVFTREQYWIDLLKPEFNVVKDVINYVIEEETKQKISNTLKEKYNSGEVKRTVITKLWQYDLQGNIIKIWDAVVDAAKQFDGKQSNIQKKIHEACRQEKVKSYKGYVWSKDGKFTPVVNKVHVNILVTDTNTDDTTLFVSKADASRFLECNVSTIDYFLKRNSLYKKIYKIERLSINSSNSVDDLMAETIPSQASIEEGVTTSA